MMKNNFRSHLTTLFTLLALIQVAQINIRDRWDTLYANVDYANTTTYRYQTANIKLGNDLVLLGDSIDSGNSASYFQYYNTTNNTLTNINYNRIYVDAGTSAGAVVTNTATSTNYVFFGAKNSNSTHVQFGVYKYSSSTNAITSETVSLPFNVHLGVMNIGTFSPNTNNDSITIFVGARMSADDSVYIYRKHYNQVGLVNTNVKLPIKLDYITKVFVFNNEMYVAGYTAPDNGKLLKSSDGITFTVVTNYETNFPYKAIVDVDVLNNKLYLGIRSYASSGFEVLETPDGTNFTSVVNNSGAYALNSLKTYNNAVWYSYFEFYGNKANNSNQNTNQINTKASYVNYFKLPSYTDILSIDTLGRYYNQGFTFQLQKTNSSLLLAGNYYDNNSANTPGNFIYKFIPPVANFSVSSNSVCLNTPYTFVNQSLNADSVRWYVDGNFNASTSNNFPYTFTTSGSHTLGLIAISGTQKDTMQFALNIYSVSINLNSSVLACLNNKIPMVPTIVGAVNPVSYNWTCSSALTQTSLASSILNVTATASGSYTFALNVTDANGCAANTGINTLTVNPNKDLAGAVNVNSVPLTSGNVILYRYEPILTKFDSITFQPLNASGTFTFALQNAFTYIIKCEPTTNTLLITYAPSETSWKTATVVSHGCINGTNQNINVIPLLNIGTGPGMLTGKVVEGQKYGGKGTSVSPGNPIGGISIKGGRNPGGSIVAQSRTNSAGEYTISNLPTNVAGESYFILVDVAGLDTNNTYHKAITTASLQINGLDFVVDSAKINPTFVYASMNELNIDNDVIRLFPNPTKGLLNIQFLLEKPQTVEIILNDITGKVVRTIMSAQQQFNKEVNLQTQLNELNPGVYIIKLKIGEAERTTKVIVTN
jgi:hypothetical protein